MAKLDDWDIYFLQRAHLISENSTCKQRHAGAVLVKNRQILATIYCTCSPCVICAKMLINAQISRFVACKEYPDDSYKSLFNEAKIIFNVLDKNRGLF